MSLINTLLKTKLSQESDATDSAAQTGEPAVTDVGATDPTAVATAATEPAVGGEPAEPTTDPVDPATEPVEPTDPVVDPAEPTAADPVEPTEPVVEPDSGDDSLVGIDEELDDVRGEVEQIQDDVTDTVDSTDTVDQLEETVQAMEALIERGSITESELRLTLNRGTRRINRLGVESFFLATESYSSEEGRMETLQLAAESFSETAGRVRDAIANGWGKLKERMSATLKRLVNTNERLKQAAVALEGKVHALPDTPATETVSLNTKDHAFLSDVNGVTLSPTELSAKLVTASKDLLHEYPKLVAAALADNSIPKINPSVLKGLSAGLTAVYDAEGLVSFTTKRESAEESRKAVKVLPKAALDKVLKNVIAATEVLSDNWIDKAFAAVDEANTEHLNTIDVLASNLLDFYWYVQRVNRALLALVETQVAHYGVKA